MASTEVVVGRDPEIDALQAFLAEPPPSVLLLEGEAGIGKTTLWVQAAGLAVGREFLLLRASPAEAEAQLSFAALGDLFADVLEGSLAGLPPPQRQALEIALLLADPEGSPAEATAVAFAVLRALRNLARERPLLLAIDDVQWLDLESARVLEFVLRRLEHERISVLLARRADGANPMPLGLSRHPGGVRIDSLALGPLSLGAVQRIIRTQLDVSPARPTLQRIHEASGGNPFYALELARALQREPAGLPPRAALPLTPDLHELLGRRLALASAQAQELLLVCAASPTPTLALAAAAGAEQETIGEAVERDLLVVDGQRLRFRHPLIGSAVYYGASAETNRALHRRLAELVVDPEERAQHLCRASVVPDAEVAAAIEDAADRAYRRGAVDSAGWLALESRRLTPHDRAEDRFRRGLKVCDYHRSVGTTPDVSRTIAELVGSATPGPLRARVLVEQASKAENVVEKLRLSAEALEEAGADPELRARIHDQHSRALEGSGRLADATRHALAELECAEASGDAELTLRAIARLGRYGCIAGNGIDSALMARGRALESDLDSFLPYHSASSALADQLMWSDDLDGARALFDRLFAGAARAGARNSLITLHLQLAELENRAGRWEAARVHAHEGEVLAQDVGNGAILEGLNLLQHAFADAHLGDVDQALERLERSDAIASRLGEELWAVYNELLRGFVELSLGESEAAAARLADLPARVLAMGVREPGLFWQMPVAIEALAAAGRLDEARAEIERLEELARPLVRRRALGLAERGRALVAAARGDAEAALRAIEAARAHHDHVPDPFERARTLLTFGAIVRRAKQKRAARDALGAALATFDELGARLWAERAQSELARIGGRAPSEGALTATEQRVAELVAEGLSTKRVAAALVVSPKTVEGHLSNIYAKLGVHSRTELARVLSERRPGAEAGAAAS